MASVYASLHITAEIRTITSTTLQLSGIFLDYYESVRDDLRVLVNEGDVVTDAEQVIVPSQAQGLDGSHPLRALPKRPPELTFVLTPGLPAVVEPPISVLSEV